MPYKIQWSDRTVYVRFIGRFTEKDHDQSYREIATHPDFDNLRFDIVDFSDVVIFDYDPTVVERHAHLGAALSLSNPNIKMAIIAPTEEGQAMAWFYKDMAAGSSWDIKVFDSTESAMHWVMEMQQANRQR